MSESLSVQSHKGIYTAHFESSALKTLNERAGGEEFAEAHFIIDSRVAELYAETLSNVLKSNSVLLIEALEENKSLDKCPEYINHLAERGVKRGHRLVVIGGGILQDITCFIAATLMRGMPWEFYPTTLLAQADSCIGSKSSINVGSLKNFVGTFTPPQKVTISTEVLDTLKPQEILSGIGEMLKVHVIAGPAKFNEIAGDYDELTKDKSLLEKYIFSSLEIKKQNIEEDEFDQGIRRIMNYGHSFGHAIESATNYGIPHGIAVSIGMDMANYVAATLDHSTFEHYERMHPTMRKNYLEFAETEIPISDFVKAISKDKKNVGANLTLILPDKEGRLTIEAVPNDRRFSDVCEEFFSKLGKGQ